MKLIFEICLLVVLFIFFSIFYALHFADPGNFIDRELRPALISSPFSRRLFNLNRIGDWQKTYSQSNSPLKVQVWFDPAFTPNLKLESWLNAMVKDTTARETAIAINPLEPPPSQYLADADLKQLHKQYTPQSDSLTLFLLGESSASPTNAGLVLYPNSIFIFETTINHLTDRPDLQDKLELSTLMHEWGHLLGLDHINQDGCIMSEKVEVYDSRLFRGSNLPTRYCGEELYQLGTLKKGV